MFLQVWIEQMCDDMKIWIWSFILCTFLKKNILYVKKYVLYVKAVLLYFFVAFTLYFHFFLFVICGRDSEKPFDEK